MRWTRAGTQRLWYAEADGHRFVLEVVENHGQLMAKLRVNGRLQPLGRVVQTEGQALELATKTAKRTVELLAQYRRRVA